MVASRHVFQPYRVIIIIGCRNGTTNDYVTTVVHRKSQRVQAKAKQLASAAEDKRDDMLEDELFNTSHVHKADVLHTTPSLAIEAHLFENDVHLLLAERHVLFDAGQLRIRATVTNYKWFPYKKGSTVNGALRFGFNVMTRSNGIRRTCKLGQEPEKTSMFTFDSSGGKEEYVNDFD